MEEHEQGNRMIQLLLATVMVGAVQEVLQVHAGVELSCPEWDCQCHQETLWEVEVDGAWESSSGWDDWSLYVSV